MEKVTLPPRINYADEAILYMMANTSRTLYIGVTNNLERRIFEHKHALVKGFTSRYNIDMLVYYEMTPDVVVAIAREKQLKGWRRSKKVELIETKNPEWADLSEGWFDKPDPSLCSG